MDKSVRRFHSEFFKQFDCPFGRNVPPFFIECADFEGGDKVYDSDPLDPKLWLNSKLHWLRRISEIGKIRKRKMIENCVITKGFGRWKDFLPGYKITHESSFATNIIWIIFSVLFIWLVSWFCLNLIYEMISRNIK